MFSGVQDGGGGIAPYGRPADRHPDRAPERLRIRGGAGLGDAIYLQSIARHFVGQGYRPEVCSDWADVFRPLAGQVDVSPFRRTEIDRLAHYSMRRGVFGTSQFVDGCIQAGIEGPVEFRLDWPAVAHPITAQAGKRPIIIVQMPRPPFARTDGFGTEFLPDCRRIQDVINYIGARAFFVQVGSGEALFEFKGIDRDLTNRTSVCDLLDVASLASGFLGYCSFIVPLAESQCKPALLVWSRKGMSSPHQVVRRMTPAKVLHRRSSLWVMDDATDTELKSLADALCDAIRH